MFKIARGQLLLDHHNARDVIDKIIQKEIEHVNDYKIAKLLWFYDNYDLIENPVTTLTWGDMTLDIHPGHIRLIAARLLGKQSIDSIILYSLDSYLDQISFNTTVYINNYLYKQPLTNYWQISTKQQEEYLDHSKNKSKIYWDHWNHKYKDRHGTIDELLKKYRKGNIYKDIVELTRS